jgi:hypothetical protein
MVQVRIERHIVQWSQSGGNRSAASFRQAAIPPHQNGGRHLCPHRPQGSLHWISRAWCGRLRRYRAGDRPPSTIRPPASVGPQSCNFWVGQCGRCGRSRPDVFWRGRQADGRDLRHTFARNPEMQQLRPDKAIALPARTRPPVLGWLSCTNTATLSEKNSGWVGTTIPGVQSRQ